MAWWAGFVFNSVELKCGREARLTLDREMAQMEHDVLILSGTLTWIHKHPENYLPGSVLDPYNGKVPPTAPCIIYSPEVRKRGIETVRKEVELAANITGTLVRLVLQRGEMIFLYTDGVTEAMNEDKKMYSEARLQETLNVHGEKNVRDILAAVRQDVGGFAGEAEQSDDMTMLGLKFYG